MLSHSHSGDTIILTACHHLQVRYATLLSACVYHTGQSHTHNDTPTCAGTSMHTCAHKHIKARADPPTHTPHTKHTHTHTQARTHTNTHAHMCTPHTHAHTPHIHTHKHIHTHTHTQTHTHMHTHTCTHTHTCIRITQAHREGEWEINAQDMYPPTVVDR